MMRLEQAQAARLAHWFSPERPGPLIGSHFIQTGYSAGHVDRWPEPRVVLVEAGGNYTLLGDADAVDAAALRGRIAGFVEAPDPFVPLLREAFPDLQEWPRVMYRLDAAPTFTIPAGYTVRLLTPADARHLHGLSAESAWISKTWHGPEGLAGSGVAWGAFSGDGRLVSVACTFFRGSEFEEIGVVTEPEFRGQGLVVACAGRLCEAIQRAGRIPSWTTSPDNVPSIRVAEKLGFTFARRDRLLVMGIPIPPPAVRPGE